MSSDVPIPDRAFTFIDGGERSNTRTQVIAVGIALPTEVGCTCSEDEVRPSAYRNDTLPYLGTRCAFVNWKDRATAEVAAQAWANGLEIDGETVNVRWGRSKGASAPKPNANAGPSSVPVAS